MVSQLPARRTGCTTGAVDAVVDDAAWPCLYADGFAAIDMKQGDIAFKVAAAERTANAALGRLSERV